MFVAAAYRAVWDRLAVRRRGKSGLSAGVLTLTPSPWMIRRTGRNRFGHELARTPVANPQRRRWPRLQTRLPLFAPHAANRSPTHGPPGEPPHGLRSDDGVAGAERLVAPRHATAGNNGSGAARHRQYARGRAVFPRRRTGAKSPPHSCRFASVRRSQRHRDVEDARAT